MELGREPRPLPNSKATPTTRNKPWRTYRRPKTRHKTHRHSHPGHHSYCPLGLDLDDSTHRRQHHRQHEHPRQHRAARARARGIVIVIVVPGQDPRSARARAARGTRREARGTSTTSTRGARKEQGAHDNEHRPRQRVIWQGSGQARASTRPARRGGKERRGKKEERRLE